MAKRKTGRAKAAKPGAKRTRRAAKSRKSVARRASAKRPSARKTTRTAKKTTRKAKKKATRQLVARKAAAAKSIKRATKKTAATKKRAPGAKVAIGIAPVQPPAPPKAAKATKAPRPKRPPTLDRARKTVDTEPHGLPSSLDFDQPPSAARSGRKELKERLKQHTSTGPAITAGDVDANWQDAETVGDEAPGGDNPTPDQDVVDDIGRALGVQYEDGEELKGGDEIASRDKHRWELDPASSDDYDDRD